MRYVLSREYFWGFLLPHDFKKPSRVCALEKNKRGKKEINKEKNKREKEKERKGKGSRKNRMSAGGSSCKLVCSRRGLSSQWVDFPQETKNNAPKCEK